MTLRICSKARHECMGKPKRKYRNITIVVVSILMFLFFVYQIYNSKKKKPAGSDEQHSSGDEMGNVAEDSQGSDIEQSQFAVGN